MLQVPLNTRRAMIGGLVSASVVMEPHLALLPASAAEQFGAVPGYAARVEGIGGGADVLSLKPAVPDVVYPPSLLGVWRVERVVVSVEGDEAQAKGAWFDLGGGSADRFRKPEVFQTRFLPSPKDVVTDGGTGTVLDRGFEMSSRVVGGLADGSLQWDATAPDTLSYERRAGSGGLGPTELSVVQRSIELPSEKGWGYDELLRLTRAAGGLFGGEKLLRAARVKRRYRRAYTEAGDRVIEALEIVKTFRVLDGVAGVEMPTSTAKSTLRFTRPPPA